MFRRSASIAVILLIILTLGTGCAGKSVKVQEFSRENFVMDTLLKISVYTTDPQLGKQALDEAFAEFSRINALADRHGDNKAVDLENSDIYKINANARRKPVQVSEDTMAMLEKSNRFADLSGGAFDITIGPVVDLWGFQQNERHIPSDEELRTKQALVDYRQIVLDREQKTVFLPQNGMALDLGGIAKGYATDMAVKKLRQLGVTSAMINAGGNVYALGSKPDGSLWRVGIQDPRDDQNIIAILSVEDAAVVSSGDYERYFSVDGVRYHHILDPSTGKPANQMMSTTVVTSSATDADVLSTALFVLGPERGRQLLEQLTDVRAVFVDAAQKVTYSESLEGQIEFTRIHF